MLAAVSRKAYIDLFLSAPNNRHSLKPVAVLVVLFLHALTSFAQSKSDTANKVPIELMPGIQLLRFEQTDSGGINKLLGNVSLKQGETMMYCDSAYFYFDRNDVEAFGNVRIIQPGSQAYSDYMRYVGNTKQAYMRGEVMLTDGKSSLWSDVVEYNVGTKIGTYANGGRLQDSTTTVTSNSGIYNLQNKDARFTGNVEVNDPQYHIISEDMGYNTGTKLTNFYAPSVVTGDSSVLTTSCGTYDPITQTAHFTCRSSVLNKEQYIEADNLHNNRKTGIGWATGNVVSIDTQQKTTLYCGRVDFNERKRTALATIKPVMKQMNDKDSLFIRADTLFSAPIPKPEDTVRIVKTVGKGKNKKQVVIVPADTMEADPNRPRYFIAYHHVLIFSDSMQGKCDSLSYTEVDSVMRMMYNPILWSRKSQITGDTILLYLDSGKAKKVYVPNNSFVISMSGPEKAGFFDQVQGKTLTANFKNNAIHDMLVRPDAQVIQFSKDEHDAYIGVNEVNGERLKVRFKDEELDEIVFEKNVKQKMTPLTKADLPAMKLSRYQWHEQKRPKSLSELFK